MKHSRTLVLSVVLALAGCASSGELRPDQLIGCYAQDQGRPATMRVGNKDGQYYLAFLSEDGKIEKQLPLIARPAPEPTESLSADMSKVAALLTDQTGVIGVLKFLEGAVVEGKKPPSDYLFLAPQVGGPVFESSCP